MDDLHVKVEGDQKILTIRQGDALPLHEVQNLAISGTLQAPGDFLSVRGEQFPKDKTHVIVDDNAGTIRLTSGDRDEIGVINITGILKLHPDLVNLGVNNSAVVRQPQDLAKFIKMNRTLFESKDVAMTLVAQLRSFKAKVNKEMEESSDDRANYSSRIQQVVESNIPDGFKVNVPLFIGETAITFVVEIVIDPDDFGCALISPDAADLVKRNRKLLLDEQLKRFTDYAVIYV